MFSTKGQEVKTGGVMKSLQPGVVHAHIYSGQVRTSRNGEKKSLELVLEGPALENFEGWAVDKNDPEGVKFTGQSSRVSATSWTDQFNENNVVKNEILGKLKAIAVEVGLESAIDKINADTIEEWVDNAIAILKGHNLYWFLKGTEEDYNGKTIVKLSLPRYRFVSVDQNKLEKFDKTNQYHYKAISVKPVAGFEPVNDEFDV